jgi:hypothetical protein
LSSSRRCHARRAALRSLNSQLREDAGEIERAVDVLAEEIDGLRPEAERWVPHRFSRPLNRVWTG